MKLPSLLVWKMVIGVYYGIYPRFLADDGTYKMKSPYSIHISITGRR